MELLQYYIRLLSFVKTNIFVETFDDRLQHVLNDNDDGAKGPNLDCLLEQKVPILRDVSSISITQLSITLLINVISKEKFEFFI